MELTREYLDELIGAIKHDNDAYIKETVQELQPADIALVLRELEDEDARYIVRLLDTKVTAEVISYQQKEERDRIFEDLAAEKMALYLQYIETDDAVDILNQQSVTYREEVIDLVDNPEKAAHILDLLHYEEDCAGGLMAKELVKTYLNWTVDQCIEEIRRQAKNVQKIYSVYVVDEKDHLKGVVSLKKLLLAAEGTLVADIYNEDVTSVETFRDEEEVASIMRKYDLEAIPVVNVHGKLLGRITIDDIVDVITEQAEKERQMMAGLSVKTEDDDSVWKISRARLPWLVIGLVGGLAGAELIGIFEGSLERIPAIAFFIPLIMATGGNVGIQSTSIMLQSLANKSVFEVNYFKRLSKVLLVAIVNGVALSLLVYGFNFFFIEGYELSLLVSISLFFVVILASFVGTLTPLLLDKAGVNPALASGPFITTTNDLLGLAVYLIVAQIIFGS